MYNPFSLEGKKILVTGASSGIGQAIAVECSRMGAALWLCGRNAEKLDETYSLLSGDSHSIVIGDLTEETSREKLIGDLPELDGVVYNAGIAKRQLCKAIKEQDIHKILDTNFISIALLQRLLLKNKKLSHNSSIVMMASRAAFSPSLGNAAYSASKGALISYAKVLGLELASSGIRVNSICPGMIMTDLVKKEFEMMGADIGEAERRYPLGRFGTPQDVAYLTVYLLSDASKWMTGSCIDISGGGEMVLT